ncbi:hypothetical protein ACFQX7_39695 [Luedemannella flava]
MEINDAPLLAAWHAYVDGGVTPFTIPGHKRAAARLWPALGAAVASDVPLFGGLDTVKLAGGTLADAEARAAALWGADWCRFSTGGSTHANQAIALAVGRPGDTVLVTRSAHRSTLLGLVLAGLNPVWLPTTVDPRFGIPSGVSPEALRGALAAHPSARAVFLVEPSYLGTVSDLPALIAASDVPVIVDQAWGAHFGFHPSLPPHALQVGAAALVTSAHKTLPAYSQASLLLARTDRLDPDRLDRAFEAGNTTSPPVPSWRVRTPRAPCSPPVARNCSTRSSAWWRTPTRGCAGRRGCWCPARRASRRAASTRQARGDPLRHGRRRHRGGTRPHRGRAYPWRWPTGTPSSRSSPWPTRASRWTAWSTRWWAWSSVIAGRHGRSGWPSSGERRRRPP